MQPFLSTDWQKPCVGGRGVPQANHEIRFFPLSHTTGWTTSISFSHDVLTKFSAFARDQSANFEGFSLLLVFEFCSFFWYPIGKNKFLSSTGKNNIHFPHLIDKFHNILTSWMAVGYILYPLILINMHSRILSFFLI